MAPYPYLFQFPGVSGGGYDWGREILLVELLVLLLFRWSGGRLAAAHSEGSGSAEPSLVLASRWSARAFRKIRFRSCEQLWQVAFSLFPGHTDHAHPLQVSWLMQGTRMSCS